MELIIYWLSESQKLLRDRHDITSHQSVTLYFPSEGINLNKLIKDSILTNLWKHRLYISSPVLWKNNILGSPSFSTSPLCLLWKEEKLFIYYATFSIKDKLLRYLFLILSILLVILFLLKQMTFAHLRLLFSCSQILSLSFDNAYFDFIVDSSLRRCKIPLYLLIFLFILFLCRILILWRGWRRWRWLVLLFLWVLIDGWARKNNQLYLWWKKRIPRKEFFLYSSEATHLCSTMNWCSLNSYKRIKT